MAQQPERAPGRPDTLRPRQLALPFAPPPQRTPAEWETLLNAALPAPIEVAYGRSRGTPVRITTSSDGRTRLRLHRFFATAPWDVAAALAGWLRAGRRARRACLVLDKWLDEQIAALEPPQLPDDGGRGRVFDLEPLRDRVIPAHVPELLDRPPPVIWGRRVRSRGRASLQLGSFDPHTDLIRIHPVLDHREVPEFLVRFVLFHELLHAAIPGPPPRGGRQVHHPASFRARERAHPDYPRAQAWEDRNLPALLRRARRGFDVDD